MIKDELLLAWNRRGFIPGPKETEESFLKRIELLEELAEDPLLFFEKRGESPPIQAIKDKVCRVQRADLDWVLAKLSRSYDLLPSWLVAYYSDEKLALWLGALCFILEIEGHYIPFIQLKKRLQRGEYLKIYRRDEILVHEAIHAVRMTFEEPKFEEVLAYLVSSSPLRRALGPLFMTSLDPWLLFAPIITGGLLLPFWPILSILFYLAGLGGIVVKLFVLFRKQMLLRRAGSRLMRLTQDTKRVRAVLLRLTDAEILYFAKAGDKEAKMFIQQVRYSSLRWRAIYLAYFQQVLL